MNVKQLKDMIANLPDDAEVLISTDERIVRVENRSVLGLDDMSYLGLEGLGCERAVLLES